MPSGSNTCTALACSRRVSFQRLCRSTAQSTIGIATTALAKTNKWRWRKPWPRRSSRTVLNSSSSEYRDSALNGQGLARSSSCLARAAGRRACESGARARISNVRKYNCFGGRARYNNLDCCGRSPPSVRLLQSRKLCSKCSRNRSALPQSSPQPTMGGTKLIPNRAINTLSTATRPLSPSSGNCPTPLK